MEAKNPRCLAVVDNADFLALARDYRSMKAEEAVRVGLDLDLDGGKDGVDGGGEGTRR